MMDNLIQHLRNSLAISQEELGKALGMTREMINKMEGGKAPVSPATEKKIRLKYPDYWISRNREANGTPGDADVKNGDKEKALLNRIVELQNGIILDFKAATIDILIKNQAYLQVISQRIIELKPGIDSLNWDDELNGLEADVNRVYKELIRAIGSGRGAS